MSKRIEPVELPFLYDFRYEHLPREVADRIDRLADKLNEVIEAVNSLRDQTNRV